MTEELVSNVASQSPYIFSTSTNEDDNFEEEMIGAVSEENVEIDQKLITTLSGQFEIGSVIKLDLNSLGLKSIKNLNRCIRLEFLDLSNNQIEKIEGFEHVIKLKRLNLSNNRIKKIEGLSIAKSLQYVTLENNEIESLEDLKDLQNLPNLKYINLKGNPVCDKEGFDETLKSLCKKLQFINGEHIALRFPSVIFDEQEETFEIPVSKSWTVDSNQNSIFTFDGFPSELKIKTGDISKVAVGEFKRIEMECKKSTARADVIIQEVARNI